MRKGKITSLLLATAIALTPTSSLAHPGKTDSSGGHNDNKNKSGLGSYHYHCGGNDAHLHDNGTCPYSSKASTKSTSSSSKSKSSSTSAKKEDIKKVQTKLNELGYDCGTADGVAGKKTTNAIKKFQEDNGLAGDGIVGAKTKEAMGI